MSTVQRITSKYKLDFNNTKIDLNRDSEAYTEVYRRDGFGLLFSAAAEFNSDKILVEMLIDGEVFLAIDCEDIAQTGNEYEFSGVLSFEKSKDVLKFKPTLPIMFRESFVIRAKANGNSSSRDFERVIVERTEE